VPVGITVEGANILTRNLIVFGQGAIRAHPYILQEMNALSEPDPEKALDRFDDAFWKHVGHSALTLLRAWGRSWSGGLISPAPDGGAATKFYRQLSRYAACFALTADMALLTMGGALKRKEMISARLGDILSELYLLSGALKRWEDEGRLDADFPLLAYCMETGLKTIDTRFQEVFANFPNRIVALFLKLVVQPLGIRRHGPRDALTRQCAEILLAPSEARDRLTPDLYIDDADDGLARLERAFRAVVAADPITKKMHDAKIRDWREAQKKGVISAAEAKEMESMSDAVAMAIDVDDFAPEELMPAGGIKTRRAPPSAPAAKAS
jgi:acyl-CoA dehydrogenase